MSDIYRQIILDYYRSPPNKGMIDNADIDTHDSNPSCGDSIRVMIKVENEKIKEAKFMGTGCAISMASVSMLLEHLIGKKLSEAEKMEKEDITKMLGTKDLTPARVKCATLGLYTLKTGIKNYRK